MRTWDEPKKRKAHIELIPMIDVMMFLLVFFVLISLNVIPALGLKTQLPSAGSAQQLKPQKKAIITLGTGDQLPGLAVRVLPTCAVPETVGVGILVNFFVDGVVTCWVTGWVTGCIGA